MSRDLDRVSAKRIILWVVFSLNALVLLAAILVDSHWLWALSVTMSLALLTLYNTKQKKHTILRNYPLLGYFRYFFESIRPEMRQYFWQSDLDGKPFNRRQRTIVYQRAKNVRQTVPFGMQDDPKLPGHEWKDHIKLLARIEHKDFKASMLN